MRVLIFGKVPWRCRGLTTESTEGRLRINHGEHGEHGERLFGEGEGGRGKGKTPWKVKRER
jgi:hypothetical protein